MESDESDLESDLEFLRGDGRIPILRKGKQEFTNQ